MHDFPLVPVAYDTDEIDSPCARVSSPDADIFELMVVVAVVAAIGGVVVDSFFDSFALLDIPVADDYVVDVHSYSHSSRLLVKFSYHHCLRLMGQLHHQLLLEELLLRNSVDYYYYYYRHLLRCNSKRRRMIETTTTPRL